MSGRTRALERQVAGLLESSDGHPRAGSRLETVADWKQPYREGVIDYLDRGALSGDWTLQKQAIALNKANGRITYRFHARDLHLVMGPAARGTSVRFSRAH